MFRRKPGKYKNIRINYKGIPFASKLECSFYVELLENIPEKDIELQKPFELQPSFKYNGKTIRSITYVSDFVIGNKVYDVKGLLTDTFRIKAKMFKYKYPEYDLIVVKRKSGKWIFE